MGKLVYEYYKGCRDVLSIDLGNNYTVLAIKGWNKDRHVYLVEFRIKENSVDQWDFVEGAENVEIDVGAKSINSAILKQVADYLESGFLDKDIEAIEYGLKCFDYGNSFFEELYSQSEYEGLHVGEF